MMTYQEIKEKHKEVYNKIMEECQVFFAFNNEQFKDGLSKIELSQGEKLVSIGAGGYMPKKHFDAFLRKTKEADKIKAKEIKEAKAEKEAAILYELKNHECFYTGELDTVMEIFKGIYTAKEIMQVYLKNRDTQD